MTERNTLVAAINKVSDLETQVLNTFEMIEMAEAENEQELLSEAEQAFSIEVKRL